ncbi:hypothetical protein ACFWDI_38775 [Streptomyces sp. NPDC060064]
MATRARGPTVATVQEAHEFIARPHWLSTVPYAPDIEGQHFLAR